MRVIIEIQWNVKMVELRGSRASICFSFSLFYSQHLFFTFGHAFFLTANDC
jgi:hypothetical protein